MWIDRFYRIPLWKRIDRPIYLWRSCYDRINSSPPTANKLSLHIIRCNTAIALGYLDPEEVIPILLKLVEDADVKVQESAIDALGHIESNKSMMRSVA